MVLAVRSFFVDFSSKKYLNDQTKFLKVVADEAVGHDRLFEIIFLQDDIAFKSANDLAGSRGIAGVKVRSEMIDI